MASRDAPARREPAASGPTELDPTHLGPRATGPGSPEHRVLEGRTLDHVGVAVADLDAASAPYLALALRPLADEEVAGQGVRVRAFDAGGALVELLAATRPDSAIARFLERRGPGLHHVAFRSPDLESDIAALEREGARFADARPRPGRSGTRVVFLHPAWGEGVLIELVEHA